MTNTPENTDRSPASAADIQRAQRISTEVHAAFPDDDAIEVAFAEFKRRVLGPAK